MRSLEPNETSEGTNTERSEVFVTERVEFALQHLLIYNLLFACSATAYCLQVSYSYSEVFVTKQSRVRARKTPTELPLIVTSSY